MFLFFRVPCRRLPHIGDANLLFVRTRDVPRNDPTQNTQILKRRLKYTPAMGVAGSS